MSVTRRAKYTQRQLRAVHIFRLNFLGVSIYTSFRGSKQVNTNSNRNWSSPHKCSKLSEIEQR